MTSLLRLVGGYFEALYTHHGWDGLKKCSGQVHSLRPKFEGAERRECGLSYRDPRPVNVVWETFNA